MVQRERLIKKYGTSIKNKSFGDDIHPHIKAKIYARQQSNLEVKFGDARTGVKERYNLDDVDLPGILSKTDFSDTTYEASDLSSRTPFVRLWTAVELYEDYNTGTNFTRDSDDRAKWIKDQKDNLEKDEFLFQKTDTQFEVHKWERFDGSRKIYQIGNHVLNTE